MHILALHDWVCKIVQWLRFVSEDLTDWILVWMTINRIAAITWATRFRSLTNLRTTSIALGTILLYSFFVNIHCLWVFSIRSKAVQFRNETYYSCSTYKAIRTRQLLKLIFVMFGFLEPIIPITILLILSIFLGIRIITVAFKRRDMLRSGSSSISKSSNIISAYSAKKSKNENSHNGSLHTSAIDQKGMQREIQLALVFISFSVAEILIEGTSNILSAVIALKTRVLKEPAQNDRFRVLKQIDFYFQDASILLRTWNLFAYLLIMPSFRHAVMDCLIATRLWRHK